MRQLHQRPDPNMEPLVQRGGSDHVELVGLVEENAEQLLDDASRQRAQPAREHVLLDLRKTH
jgi:hypothetical protein